MIPLLALSALAADVPAPAGPAADPPTDEDALEVPDRSAAPAVRPPEALQIDDLVRHDLGNGVEAWYARVPRIRKARVEVFWWKGYVELGQTYDPRWALTNAVWDVASEQYDGDTLSILADTREIEVVCSIGDHQSSLELSAPVEELIAGLDVLEDVLFHPTFPKRELKLNQENAARYWSSIGPSSPSSVAGSALGYAWNPADHPYGWRPDPARYAKVKTKDLFAAHDSLIRSGPVSILVVGDVPWETLEPELKRRFGSLGSPGDRAQTLDAPMPTATRVIAVDMPKSEQAVIRMRMPAPARPSPERVGMAASSFALGGHFLARLNKNLREDKGWTYGVGAWYGAGDLRGSFNVSVDVPADKLAGAVTEIEKEITAVASDGVTPEELDAWWRGAVTDFNSVRATSDSAYGFYYDKLDEEETVADDLAWMKAIADTTPDSAKAVASTWLGADAPRVWVVVGPKPALEAGFAELGWTPEWVTPQDAILGKLVGGPL